MVSGTTGMLASSPNCANAATIRGSDRGSVAIEHSGSARRPSAMWRRYIDEGFDVPGSFDLAAVFF
jgi:hypothetical protein